MKTLVVGYGEVGRAHFNILSKAYPGEVYIKDIGPEIRQVNPKDGIIVNRDPIEVIHSDLLLVATQCDPKNISKFIDMVLDYVNEYEAPIVDILTTTPCGTVDILQETYNSRERNSNPGNEWKVSFNRSSVRGMHPHLDKFLLDIPKHIGGPSTAELKGFYEKAGITCITHEKARTVELAHILNNFLYGCAIMATDEAARYCRELGVDYMEFLEYRKTNNSGFLKAGYPSKVSPILYPSGGSIGGHCVKYAPSTIPDNIKGPLAKMLQNHK